ncbi:MAG: hypothetical protein MMC33_009079 [Icmadophila ericetorum]|nr:hypothetical protein [Icmadophila ericetorum]
MVSVASLLNPAPLAYDNHQPSPYTKYKSDLDLISHPPAKKVKVAKDAASFVQDSIRGKIRYRPCEDQDDETAKEHQRFNVYPMGHIAEFRRHIPYNSDKKTFMEKTGRESFEVYQYTFKLPEDESNTWTVMWDYNIGLVRITPFFKCQQYPKTMPAKMLNNNPGLREICHSITGGALAAQGYWMPFEAAKGVAATFCYPIRYALTPIFGLDFVSLCIKPGVEGYGHMVIDPEIVKKCTLQATQFREEASSYATKSTWRPDPLQQNSVKALNIKSGYPPEADGKEKCPPTPLCSPQWTSVNTPRSSVLQRNVDGSEQSLLTPKSMSDRCDVQSASPKSAKSEDGIGWSTGDRDGEIESLAKDIEAASILNQMREDEGPRKGRNKSCKDDGNSGERKRRASS